MDKEKANKEAKKIYEDWQKERQSIEKEAKASGIWKTGGLDSNNHLFKEVDAKAQKKLQELSSITDNLNDTPKIVHRSTLYNFIKERVRKE